jgi:two-component system nitrogen regulation response regulator GlnG/two-component system response regulator HydG
MPPRDPHESTLRGSSVQQGPGAAAPAPELPALVLVWSEEEPGRVGEVLCLPRAVVGVPFTVGRATEPGEDGALPLMLQRLRPFSRVETGPLRGGRVSRWQLRVQVLGEDELRVERVGRGTLRVRGHDVERAEARVGDLIEVPGRFSLLVSRRPTDWPRGEPWYEPFAFGAADAGGIVGESPAAWELRRQIAFVARGGGHVLVHGASGVGKELVVRALHRRSPRAGAPLVARNAATIPETLIDAELFGNLRDYPNPGMPDRVGLLGEAHGGALFLDEIGELPHALQAHLLRVMDGGEYQRLGEPRRRAADVQVLGATNRDPAQLKHDLLARFVHRVRVPGLDERREDLPLLARHLLRELAATSPELRGFFAGDEPRLSAELVAALIWRPYTTHVREVARLLWQAAADSPGAVLLAPRGAAEPPPPGPEPHALPTELTREQVLAALEACGGVREQTWRALGLRSRDQLKRLLKKFGIS